METNDITVSAIITTHNRISVLPTAIQSVFRQTYPCVECIVVDDASSDGTKEYCESLSQIRYFHLKEGRGANYARNVGIDAAKGDVVAFLDDDDYWKPAKIEKQVRLMNEKNCSLVYCGVSAQITDKDGTQRNEVWINESDVCGVLDTYALCHTFCLSSSIMVKKELFDQVGKFDEEIRYWQDYEFLIRAAQMTEIHFVQEPLFVYSSNRQDKCRKTNHYYEWKESIKYIQNKHRRLFACLSFEEYCRERRMVYYDAFERSAHNDLRWEEQMNTFKYKIFKHPNYLFIIRFLRYVTKITYGCRSCLQGSAR